jgi:hypothetical protein
VLKGIAKTIKRDDEIIFVDIESHNANLLEITKAFSRDFVGNRRLLKEAASIHDLWKSRTMTPEAILKGGNLFTGHGSEFPSFLVDEHFDEIEFDAEKRRENYEKYYILNLIRLHHSGFSTFNLYRGVDFIYESDKNVHQQITCFIRDWYALKTADWTDSTILSSVFQGTDLEKDLKSDLEVAQEDEDNFYIVQPGALAGKLKLRYNFSSMKKANLEKIIKNNKGRKAGMVLNNYFLESDKEVREVILRGN